MITGGILQITSGLFGLLSGSVSKGLEVWSQKVNNAHELAIRDSERRTMELQSKLAIERITAEAGAKLDDTYYHAVTEEIEAARANWAEVAKDMFAPTGLTWLDTANKAIRPITMIATLLLFFGTLIAWLAGFPINSSFGAAMGEMFTEMAYASIFYYFGYRSIPKPPSKS